MAISTFAKIYKSYPNPLHRCVKVPWIMCNHSGPCTKSTLTELNYIVTHCTMQFFHRWNFSSDSLYISANLCQANTCTYLYIYL